MIDTTPSALFVAAFCAAAIVLSGHFACATPFAALATLAALTRPGRAALLCVGAAWLLNQVIGFGLLGYPADGATIGWGFALGASALLAVPAARGAGRFAPIPAARAATGLLAAFAAYEAGLCVAALVLPGSVGAYAPAVVARLFLINLGTLAGAMLLRASVAALARPRLARPRLAA
ncbi:hypothetical protein [Methylobacterium segetis]|uniref:hypothetical protein n=1 Tax=Methylobacterium segetis TaxID=2488750 RepID=UPI001FDFE408|nr:hypothetical protein [Methylobacterium segetis]